MIYGRVYCHRGLIVSSRDSEPG